MRIINKNRIASITLASVLAIMLVIPNVGNAAEEPVNLGSASSFAVLAGSTITNTGDTVISGDVGLDPGSAITGWETTTGSSILHINDVLAISAKTDLVTAYNDGAGRTPVTTIPTELGGTTLKAGVYDSTAGTFGITGTLTLDAEGNADAVFIFNADSTLITASGSDIVLINGANSCQVFWRVGSSATLGTDSNFVGTIMALKSITANNGATINGRLLARDEAVTLDKNVINATVCVIGSSYTPPIEEEPPVEPVVEYDEEEEESRIRIEKVVLDEDGNEIANDDSEFTFEVSRRVEGNWRSEDIKTVEGNGTVQFRNLNDGTYKIEEIDIPDDYYLDSDNAIEVRLSGGETERVQFTNIREDEEVLIVEEPESIDEPETTEESEPIEAPVTIVAPENTEEPDTDVPVTIDVPETPDAPETPNPRLPATGAASTTAFSGLGASFLLAGFALLKNKK